MGKVVLNRQKHTDMLHPGQTTSTNSKSCTCHIVKGSIKMRCHLAAPCGSGCNEIAGNLTDQQRSMMKEGSKNLSHAAKMKEDYEKLLPNSESYVKRILTEEEKTKVHMLEDNFFTKFESTSLETNENMMESCGLLNMGVTTVKKLVSFIKLIDEFRNLSLEIQTSCLKAHLVCCVVWVAVAHYDAQTKSVIYQQKTPLHINILRGAFQLHLDLIERFSELCSDVAGKMTVDIPIQSIILCILIFNPEGENLKNCRHLSNIQDYYLILLKHYMESKYSFREGKELYIYFLQKVQDIKYVSGFLSEVAHKLDVKKIEPLMREVFNC